jgi:elongation factor Tu
LYSTGDSVPFVIGSALAAMEGKHDEIGRNSVIELLKVIDEKIKTPEREIDKPFLMPIEHVYSIQGKLTRL